MVARSRRFALAACLAAVAAAAWFLAGGANGPGPSGSPPTTDAEPEGPVPAEAPALAAPVAPAGGPAAKPAAGDAEREAAAAEPVPEGRVRVHGRVVRERGAPAPGARVVLRLGGREDAATAVDGGGRFALVVERPREETDYGLLVARDPEGHVASRVVPWRTGSPFDVATPLPSDVDLGDVALLPPLALEILAREPSGATEETEVWVAPPAMLTRSPLAAARTDAKGRARVEGLHAGTVYVVAYVPGRSRGAAFVVLPRESPEPAEIVLEPVRDVTVTVEEEGTGARVAGATVSLTEHTVRADTLLRGPYVPPLAVPPTGPDGRTRIPALAAKATVFVSAEAHGFASPSQGPLWGPRGAQLGPDATEVTVRLAHVRRVEWPVEAGEVPTPPDGTAIRLRASAGSGTARPPAEARLEGGRIAADGFAPGPVHAVATAPDGSTARLFAAAGEAVGHPTKFLRRRTILAHLTWSDGSPAAGVTVLARNQGNNPMGAPARTDAEGRAALADLEVQQADVYVSLGAGSAFGGRRVATCDLALGDGRVEAVLPRWRAVVAHVFLDGTPGLPAGLRVWWAESIDEKDEATGTLRWSVWPIAEDAPLKVTLEAPGWIIDPVEVPPPSGAGPVEVRVDARRAGSLRVEIRRPADGRFRLAVERWDPATESWGRTAYDSNAFGPGRTQPDAEGRWTLPTLPAGRYRVREAISGSVSPEVEVVAGAEPAVVRFDLSRDDFVSGRVAVPEGESPAGITVRRADLPAPRNPWEPGGGTTTDARGEFRLRLPGDGEYEILAESMLLVPSSEGGRARVRAGATGVLLRLRKGPVARVRFDREPAYRVNPGEVHVETYHLWRGPRQGPPTSTGRVRVEGRTATFAGFEPGLCTVMLDLLPCAPVLLEDVALGEGETDLGVVTLSEGTSLLFEVRVPAGQTAPRVSVFASVLGETPPYQRWGEVGAKGRIPGLGKGRFRVVASPVMGGGPLYDRELEVDGATDVPIVIETR